MPSIIQRNVDMLTRFSDGLELGNDTCRIIFEFLSQLWNILDGLRDAACRACGSFVVERNAMHGVQDSVSIALELGQALLHFRNRHLQPALK